MKSRILISLVVATICAAFCQAASSTCEEALVRATYNHLSSDHLDQRLALFVTQSEYDEIKHDAGANAVIYGVPVGASYSDFQTRARSQTSSTQQSLTHDQASNIMWTGLDPNSPNAYSQCLQTQVLSLGGLHLSVKGATTSDIALIATWRPEGKNPSTIPVQWGGDGRLIAGLPKQLTSGQADMVVRRPTKQSTLVINYPGFGDSVTLEPLPPLPPIPTTALPPCTHLDNQGHCISCSFPISLRGNTATQFFNCPNMAAGKKEASLDATLVTEGFNTANYRLVELRLQEKKAPKSLSEQETIDWLGKNTPSDGLVIAQDSNISNGFSEWLKLQGTTQGDGGDWWVNLFICTVNDPSPKKNGPRTCGTLVGSTLTIRVP